MSPNANANELDRAGDDREGPPLPTAVEATETYQTEGGTVFYDAENPIAWIQVDEPVRLRHVA
jgi:hypothetical protein